MVFRYLGCIFARKVVTLLYSIESLLEFTLDNKQTRL